MTLTVLIEHSPELVLDSTFQGVTELREIVHEHDQKDARLGHVWVNLEDPKRGSVGYWLLPEARGKGFAIRLVRMISWWALRDLGLARLSISAEPSNEDSRQVARRSGSWKRAFFGRMWRSTAGASTA